MEPILETVRVRTFRELLSRAYPPNCIVLFHPADSGPLWCGLRVNGAWPSGGDPRFGWPIPMSLLDESDWGYTVESTLSSTVTRDGNSDLILFPVGGPDAEAAVRMSFLEQGVFPPCNIFAEVEITAMDTTYGGSVQTSSRFAMRHFAEGETSNYMALLLVPLTSGTEPKTWYSYVLRRYAGPSFSSAAGGGISPASSWRTVWGGCMPLQFSSTTRPQFYCSAMPSLDSYENRGSGTDANAVGWDWSANPDQGLEKVVFAAVSQAGGSDYFTVTVKTVRAEVFPLFAGAM